MSKGDKVKKAVDKVKSAPISAAQIPLHIGESIINTIFKALPERTVKKIITKGNKMDEKKYMRLIERLELEWEKSSNHLVRGDLEAERKELYGDDPTMNIRYPNTFANDNLRPPIMDHSRVRNSDSLGDLAPNMVKNKDFHKSLFKSIKSGRMAGNSFLAFLIAYTTIAVISKGDVDPAEAPKIASSMEKHISSMMSGNAANSSDTVNDDVIQQPQSSFISLFNKNYDTYQKEKIAESQTCSYTAGTLDCGWKGGLYATDKTQYVFNNDQLIDGIADSYEQVLKDSYEYNYLYSFFMMLLELLNFANPFAIGAAFFASRHIMLQSFHRGLAKPVIEYRDFYNQATKDAYISWDAESAEREVNRNSFIDQCKLYKGYLSKTGMDRFFFLGFALGIAASRNVTTYNAPLPGQAVAVDLESMMSNSLAMGKPGSGKTRTILIPMIKQAIAANHGLYVTDAKGVLSHDVVSAVDDLAKQGVIDRRDDVVIVGTKKGHSGVNLLSELPPDMVKEMIAVASQKSANDPFDPFWDGNGLKLLHNCCIYAYMLSHLKAGDNFAFEHAMSVYSIGFIAKLVIDDELRKSVEVELIKALSPKLYHREGALIDRIMLTDALTYFNNEVPKLEKAENTWTGIIATTQKYLAPFVELPDEAKDRFIFCNYDKMVEVDSALDGKIMCIALNAMEVPKAKNLAIFIKSRFMNRATMRQVEHADRGEDVRAKARPCMLVADEYQDLVTISKDIESDYSFPNRNRSTGVYLFVAFQSKSSLDMAIGKENSDNIVSVFQNVIVLPVNDHSTHAMVSSMTGETHRYRTFNPNVHENFLGALRANRKYRSLPDISADIDRAFEGNLMSSKQPGIMNNFNNLKSFFYADYSKSRDISANHNGSRDTVLESINAEYEAEKEARDRNASMMKDGNEKTPVFTSTEIGGFLSRNNAIMIFTVAGRQKVDMVYVGANPDYTPIITDLEANLELEAA